MTTGTPKSHVYFQPQHVFIFQHTPGIVWVTWPLATFGRTQNISIPDEFSKICTESNVKLFGGQVVGRNPGFHLQTSNKNEKMKQVWANQ